MLNNQANATGRSATTVREFLEKYYTPEEVSTEKGTMKLAIRALLEVVQSGQKNLEIAVMRRGQPLQVNITNNRNFNENFSIRRLWIELCRNFKRSTTNYLQMLDAEKIGEYVTEIEKEKEAEAEKKKQKK